MIPRTTTLSSSKRTPWDKHCLLVIQFPISLQADIRRSARFAEVKRGLRQSFDRFGPHRALDFLLNPSTVPFSLGFDPSPKDLGQNEVSPLSPSALSV